MCRKDSNLQSCPVRIPSQDQSCTHRISLMELNFCCHLGINDIWLKETLIVSHGGVKGKSADSRQNGERTSLSC